MQIQTSSRDGVVDGQLHAWRNEISNTKSARRHVARTEAIEQERERMRMAKKTAVEDQASLIEDTTPLKMTKLEIENFMRASDITLDMPDNNVLVIEARNRQGKTSAVRALAALLGGADMIPDDPIHGDEQSGKIVGHFGDIVVALEFTKAKKPKLTIRQKGRKAALKNAPTLLKQLLGQVTLDPGEFMLKSDADKLKTLSELMGFRAEDFDEPHKKLYDERTILGRELKRLTAAAESSPIHEDAPEAEVSVAALMTEMEKRRANNAEGDRLDNHIESRGQEITGMERTIKDLEAELEEAKSTLKNYRGFQEHDIAKRAQFERQDEDEIRDQIASADEINAKVRANATALRLVDEAAEQQAKIDAVETQMQEIKEAKAKALVKARERLPIKELSLTKDAILYEGKPLSQAGASAELDVGAEIAMALNPDKRIRMLLVDNAERYDDESTARLIQRAHERDYQVMLTRVIGHGGVSSEASVVIVDGVSQ